MLGTEDLCCSEVLELSRRNLKGQTKWDKPVSAISSGFLRFPAKIYGSRGFLCKSALPKCCNSQEKRKSARKKKLRVWLRLSLSVCPCHSTLEHYLGV